MAIANPIEADLMEDNDFVTVATAHATALTDSLVQFSKKPRQY